MRIKPPNKAHLRVATLAILIVMCTLLMLSAVFPFPEGTWDFLSIGTSQKVLANPDWLSGWAYRKSHNLIGAEGSGTNYQMQIVVHSGSGSDSGDDVYLDSHCSDFPRDVTFTDDDGTTLLDFWCEDMSADPATYWVEVADNLGSNQSIYIYYGLPITAETATADEISSSALKLYTHNVEAHAREPVWTFNGAQYATFVDSSYNVIAAKRTLPDGEWSTQDTGYNVDADSDTHNAAQLGIDPNGYIHIMFNFHSDGINGRYIISDDAEDISDWTSKTQMTGSNESAVTYPTFFTDGSYLYCLYRNQGVGYFAAYLNKYDHSTTTWSAVNHPLIDDHAVGSKYPYWNGVAVGGTGVFHIFWCWRTYGGDWDTNIDICYAQTDDAGSTWLKSDDETEYSLPITTATAEVADDIAASLELMNQHDSCVDSSGYPHTVYWREDSDGRVNIFHTWFNGSSWATNQVTDFEGLAWPSRLAILASGTDIIILFVSPKATAASTLYAAKASASYTSWVFYKLGTGTWRNLDPRYDREYWDSDSKLHIFASDVTEAAGSTSVYVLETTPSSWSNSYTFAEMFGGSDGDATFLTFEDFDWGFDADALTNDGGKVDWSVSTGGNSVAEIDTAYYHTGMRSGRIYRDGSNTVSAYFSQTAADKSYSIIYHMRQGTSSLPLFCHGDGSNAIAVAINKNTTPEPDEWQLAYFDGAAWNFISDALTTTTWYEVEINDIDFTNQTCDIYLDGVLKADDADVSYGTASYANGIYFRNSSGGTSAWNVDNVIVRKYVSPEPTHGAWGSEEAFTVSITNSPDNYGFGTVAIAGTGTTGLDYFTITNTGNCAVDITIQGTDATGGDDTWDLADDGNPGENIYALKAGLDGGDYTVIVKKTATYNTLVSDLAEDATQDWGIKIWMPTSLSGYDAQQMTATITLVASES